MAKKDFKQDTTQLFLTKAEPEPEPEKVPEAPKGYKLIRESKSDRTQILLRPSTKRNLKAVARERDMSLNELINTVLEKYLIDWEKENNGKY